MTKYRIDVLLSTYNDKHQIVQVVDLDNNKKSIFAEIYIEGECVNVYEFFSDENPHLQSALIADLIGLYSPRYKYLTISGRMFRRNSFFDILGFQVPDRTTDRSVKKLKDDIDYSL